MPVAALLPMIGGALGSAAIGGTLGTVVGTVGGGLLANAIGGSGGGNPVQGMLGQSPTQAGVQAQQMVDPFAAYRPSYAQQLNALMANPASVQNLPGFQAEQKFGTQAVERMLAQRGQIGSGAERMALLDYSSGLQNRFFNEQYAKLAQLSGAAVNPAIGGQAGIGAAQQAAGVQSANIGALTSQLGGFMSGMFGGAQTAANTPVDFGLPYANAGTFDTGFNVTMPNFGI